MIVEPGKADGAWEAGDNGTGVVVTGEGKIEQVGEGGDDHPR